MAPKFDNAGPSSLSSVPVRHSMKAGRYGWFRRLFAFAGPGYIVAVGYIDPGNWATDLAGGSAFGYELLWVVALSSLMAMMLQVMSARLGIVTGMDLAQACRAYHPRTAVAQWLLCELAICACDLAEVIGTAIGLKLLFGIPLPWGVGATVIDVMLILWLQKKGSRYLEALVIALFIIVLTCFVCTLILSRPNWFDVAGGLVPTRSSVTDSAHLMIAIGILGATVMPHNLYLHSSVAQHDCGAYKPKGQSEKLVFATIDTVVALTIAFCINAAILITAAAVFHTHGYHAIAELQDAYRLIGPVTGSGLAALLFGTALLASGQSSSLTATLAGQIIMEGFLKWKAPSWLRRLLTRIVVVTPTLAVVLLYDESVIGRLLILSQIVLSLQLPFAIYPLLRFTSNAQLMGEHANKKWLSLLTWSMLVLITGLNLMLAWQAFF